MKINFEKLKTKQGVNFDKDEQQAIFYLEHLIDYLKTHNKNLTKEQFYKIDFICDFIDCLEV